MGVYAGDLTDVDMALSGFGVALEAVGTPDDLRRQLPALTADLDRFDAAVARMQRYTVNNAAVEQQRAHVVRTGPRLSELLRRFVAAAEEGDTAAIQALVPELREAIRAFAAGPEGP